MNRFVITILISLFIALDFDEQRKFIDPEVQLLNEINLSDYEIFMPQSIDVDTSGNIVFFDRGLSKIVIVSESNFSVSTFGDGKGRGPREFQRIWDLQLDNEGNIYLTDMDKQKIIKWNTKKEFKGEVSIDGRFVRPSRFTLCDDSKTIYLLSAQYGPKGIIHKYDIQGKHLNSFMQIKDREERLPYYTDGEMDCDENGNLYYSGRFTNVIRKYDPQSKVIFDRKVIAFEGNENITEKDGRFTSLAEGVKRATGEVSIIKENLIVAFSGRQDGRLKILDIYSSSDGAYKYSFEMPNYFESYSLSKNRIVTFEKNESGDTKLCVYKYQEITN